MAKPSEILTKRKTKDEPEKKGADKDDAPKRNSLTDWIAKHKKANK